MICEPLLSARQVVATEAVIIKAIHMHDERYLADCKTLRLILQHDGGLGTTPAMAEAAETLCTARLAEVTKILLEHKPLDKKIADILTA